MCTLILCLGFLGNFFHCLVGCFSMVVWTPSVLSVLYAYVLYVYICTCSEQLSMFHMVRRSRNPLIIITIVITATIIFCVKARNSLMLSLRPPFHSPSFGFPFYAFGSFQFFTIFSSFFIFFLFYVSFILCLDPSLYFLAFFPLGPDFFLFVFIFRDTKGMCHRSLKS